MSGPVTTVATSTSTYRVGGREQTLDAVLLVVPLVRAATGRPVPPRAAQPYASTRHPHARARAASGGYLVIAGRPDLALRAAPAPSTTITVDLAVPGEPVISRAFTIATGSALPAHEPAWELDDPPLTVTGTVRRQAFPFPAVPSATVVAGTGAAAPPAALALRTPLALDHAAGTTAQACTLTAGPATTLAAPVGHGALGVVLASTAAIAAGTVLELGDEATREHLVVDGPGAAAGEISLRTPVVRSAASGTVVATYSASVLGPSPALTRAGRVGDGLLLLDSLPSAVAGAAAVQITDGPRSEIRAPHALTDAAGHFRLPGVRSLAAIELTATGPSGTGPSVTTAVAPVGGPVLVDLPTP